MGLFDLFKRKTRPTNPEKGQSSKASAQKRTDIAESEKERATAAQAPSFTIGGRTVTFDDKTKANLAITQQALVAYESKNYSKALELYNQVIDSDPTAHQYYQFRGTVYEDMGNDTLAKKDFEKSIELEPGNTTSLYRLAMVYHRRNDLEKAIVYLRKAYDILSQHDDELGKEFGYKDLTPGSYNTILMVHKRVIAFNLANFLVQTNNEKEAIPILDELIKYCPTYSYPYFVKAIVCAQKQQIKEATELANKAAKYGHPQASALLGQLSLLSAQHTPSEDRFTKMIKSSSYNPFNISCDPQLQNRQNLPNLRETFERELNNLYRKANQLGDVSQKTLIQLARGYAFSLVESYYNNAGYVPKNSLDQILEQVFDAMQNTGFSRAFATEEDFKYNCYYGFLNP